MKKIIFTTCILIYCTALVSQTLIPITWDISDVNNCDADGSLTISNNGSVIQVLQMEGPDCATCTTINTTTGSCDLDSSGTICSNSPNILTANVPIYDYEQINISAIISPTGTSHEASPCSISDWAFIYIISSNNTDVIEIGDVGLNNQINTNLIYYTQDCDESLNLVIVTKSNAISDNEGYVFNISLVGSGDFPSDIPQLQDLDIDIPTIGCPGGITEINITNCPNCTSISATPLSGGSVISSTGSVILIPIPVTVTQGPLSYQISYTDGICEFTFPIDVPYVSPDLFSGPFFPNSFCSGINFDLPTSFDFGSNTVNGNWSGIGVNNNEFTDPNNGLLSFTITFTATNCLGLTFTQIISIAPPNYEGIDKIIGTLNSDYNYETDGRIESEQIISAPANIIYDSGIEIELEFPFEVGTGAVFHAFIDGCSN